MTAARLRADLHRRGVALYRAGGRLRYCGPAGSYTAADRVAVAAHRDELLALLRDVATLEADGTAACLRELHAGLTDAERARLDKEGAAGDVLARLVLDALAEPPAPSAADAVADVAVTITRVLAPDGPGWCAVCSRVLAVDVVFARDADVAVPEPHAGLPTFTREELAVPAEQKPDAERLRAIVDVKREMPGTRVVRDTGEPLTQARDVFEPQPKRAQR